MFEKAVINFNEWFFVFRIYFFIKCSELIELFISVKASLINCYYLIA